MKRVAAKTRSEGQGGLHGVVEVDLPREGTGPTCCCCRAGPNGWGDQPCLTESQVISAMRPGRSCNPRRNRYGTGPDNGPRSSGFRPCGDSPDPVGVGTWSEINRPIPPKHREGPESYHLAGRAGRPALRAQARAEATTPAIEPAA